MQLQRSAEQSDPDTRQASNGGPRVGVVAFLRARVLAGVVICLAACAGAPEDLPAALDAARAAGDRGAVEQLLTEDSRALLATMREAPHPEGRDPFGLHTPMRKLEVLQRTDASDGGVILRVSDGEREAEWIVRQEAGRWRLDLAASSTRRAFFGL
jgi:hypothetical protein